MDHAELLDLLNRVARPITSQQQQLQQPQQQFVWPPSDQAHLYAPAQPLPTQFFPPPPPPPPPQQPPNPQHAPSTFASTPTPPPPKPDDRVVAKSITTLAAANRHIVRTLAPRADFRLEIRRLRDWQRGKERVWAEERSKLIKRHENRGETQALLSAILGGNVGPPPLTAEQELKKFDLEIYAKSRNLVAQCEAEFDRLNVPLFVTGVDYGVEKEVLGEWRLRVSELLEDLCEEV